MFVTEKTKLSKVEANGGQELTTLGVKAITQGQRYKSVGLNIPPSEAVAQGFDLILQQQTTNNNKQTTNTDFDSEITEIAAETLQEPEKRGETMK